LTKPRFFVARGAADNFSTFLCRDEKFKASKSQAQADHRAEQIKGPSRSQAQAQITNQAAQDRITAVGSARGDKLRLRLAGFANATKRMRWPHQEDDWRHAPPSLARALGG
jgi:hypothetical protein